jgi:hypothetical protein
MYVMKALKELMNGNIVGYGSDYIVVEKSKKRFFVHVANFRIHELRNSVTPYWSDF